MSTSYVRKNSDGRELEREGRGPRRDKERQSKTRREQEESEDKHTRRR